MMFPHPLNQLSYHVIYPRRSSRSPTPPPSLHTPSNHTTTTPALSNVIAHSLAAIWWPIWIRWASLRARRKRFTANTHDVPTKMSPENTLVSVNVVSLLCSLLPLSPNQFRTMEFDEISLAYMLIKMCRDDFEIRRGVN